MTVQRPIISGFHPDPTVCRVGDAYYLATSTFEYAPGVPIFRSTDLRSWELIGHALARPEQLDVSAAGPSGGIFAPTLRHHDGRFWMITTNWSDDGGQLITWAEDPAGPWSTPARIPSAIGIDPDLFWDDDGRCLMTYAGFGPGGGEGIVQSEIDPETGRVLTERRWLWSGTGGKFPEGPHLYKIEGWFYLLVAEGGTERGHAVTAARSRTPQGPFESSPRNPVLTHRGTDLPVQNTGHADLVQGADGGWRMVFHGVRARGSSPEWHVLGRETFADEVTWEDGWPVVGDHIDPDSAVDSVVREALDGELPLSWVGAGYFPEQVVSREPAAWCLTAPVGTEPVFVGRRQEHLYASVCARISTEGRGGIALRIDPRHSIDLEISDGTVRAVWAVGDVRTTLGERAWQGETLEIRTLPSDGHQFSTARGPDLVVAGVVVDAAFVELGRIDGRYLSTEVAGGMTGRMFGAVCADGTVRIESFEYQGSDEPTALY